MIRFIARHPLGFGLLASAAYLVVVWSLFSLAETCGARIPRVLFRFALWTLPPTMAFTVTLLPMLVLRRSSLSTRRLPWLILMLPLLFAVAQCVIDIGSRLVRYYRQTPHPSWTSFFSRIVPVGVIEWLVVSGAIVAVPAALLGLLIGEIVAERRLRSGRWTTIVPLGAAGPATDQNAVTHFVADHPLWAATALLLPFALLPHIGEGIRWLHTASLSPLSSGAVVYLAAAFVLAMLAAATVAFVRAAAGRRLGVVLILPLFAALESYALLTLQAATSWDWGEGFLGAVGQGFLMFLRTSPSSIFEVFRASFFVAALGALIGVAAVWLWARTRSRTKPSAAAFEEQSTA